MVDGTLKFDTKIDTNGYQNGINKIRSIGSGILGATSKVMAAVSGAVMGAGAAAIKVGSDFDAATSQIAATMGQPKAAIQDIIDEAETLGATTKFTATEAAEGFNILAMSGLDAQEQISAMKPILDLAAAGAYSLDTASSQVVGTIKGYGDSFDHAQKYTDMFAKGATMASTDVESFGQAMSGTAATASSFGQGADRTAVALLRLAEQNITGSMAVTKLNRVMQDLYTPLDQGKKKLEELGIAAYDEQGKARDLNTIIDELNATLSGMSEQEANAAKNAIFSKEGFEAFSMMTVTSTEKVKEFEEGLASASDGMGAAADQAATQLDNLQGDITILQSGLDGLGNAVYKSLDGPLRSVAQTAQQVVNGLTAAVKEDGLQGLAEASGAALMQILSTAAQMAPGVVQIATQIITSFVQSMSQNAPQLLEIALQLGQTFLSGFLQIGDSVFQTALTLIQTLTQSISQNLPQMIPVAMQALLTFSENLRANFGQLVDAGLEMIVALATALIDNIPTLIETVPEIITNLAGCINDNAPKILATGIELIIKLGQGLLQAIPTLIENIPQIIQAICAVFTAFNWLNLGESIIKFIGNGVKNLTTHIPELIHEIVQTAHDIVVNWNWLSLGRGIIEVIGQGISELISLIPDALSEIASWAADAFINFDWWGIGTACIDGIIAGIAGSGNAIWNAAMDIGSSLFEGVKSFFGIASPSKLMKREIGRFIPPGIGEGVKDEMPALKEDVNHELSKFTDSMNIPLETINFDSALSGLSDRLTTTVQFAQAQTAQRQSVTSYKEIVMPPELTEMIRGMAEESKKPIEMEATAPIEVNVDGSPLYQKAAKFTIKEINNQQQYEDWAKGRK